MSVKAFRYVSVYMCGWLITMAPLALSLSIETEPVSSAVKKPSANLVIAQKPLFMPRTGEARSPVCVGHKEVHAASISVSVSPP